VKNTKEFEMAMFWQAVIQAKIPGGGKSWNGNQYQSNTVGQIVTIRVPDANGYFATKALLESAYGSGSVLSLIEVR
jgi:hypothetical protein